jgi:type II secretory pathway component PulC
MMEREISAKLRKLPKLPSSRVRDDASIAAALMLCLGLCSATVGAEDKIFTASDPTVNGEPEDLLEDEPEEPSQPALSLCQTELRLSGTFYNAQAPQRSFASFHVRAERAGGEVYRVGERVGPFGILSIEERTVVLDDGGAGCYLKLAGASVPPPAAPAKKPHKKKRRKKGDDKAVEENAEPPKPEEKGDFSAEELNASIRALGGDKYEIKKDLLPKLALRSAALRSSTQWSQVRGYSSVLGLRLEKLASAGLFEKLGLRTGDMIKTLNGLQLSSLDGALEAQKLISSSSHLSLLIQRDGSPVTLEYRVVP